MCFLHKLIKRTGNSEQGFVLIVAIMAAVILMAIGFFALTMISGDLMISARITCERKAYSAAESGVHAIYASSLNFNQLLTYSSDKIYVDPTNDSSSYYNVVQTTNTNNQAPGVGGGSCTNCKSFIYDTVITGHDSCGSQVSISIGMAPPSTQSDTQIISGTQPGE